MFKAATKNKANKSNNTPLFQKNEKARQTFFQPKLNVGTPGDKYEVEADKVADQVIDHSLVTEQSFFTPSVSPPVNSGQPAPVQQKPVADGITPLLQRQDEEEEMMQMQPVEEEEIVQSQAEEEEETIQQQLEEEEEPLQMQPVEEEEEMVQGQMEEDEMVQQQHDEGNEPALAEAAGGESLQQQTENIQPAMPNPAFSAIQKQEVEEEEPVEVQASEDEERRPVMAEKEGQVQAKADSAPAIPEGFESGLNGSKGSGSPLPSGVKSQMETGFGTDFSNVRIHTGSGAAQMSRQIGAQAFTHGSDIYFNEGKFNPASQSGQHLIAHELTHTIQQGASVQPKLIQRVEGEEVAETLSSEHTFTDERTREEYSIDTSKQEAVLPTIGVPRFKVPFGPGTQFNLPVGGSERENNHIPVWEEAAMGGSGFTQEFESKIQQENAPELMFNNSSIYYLTLKGGTARQRRGQAKGEEGVIFGNQATIKRRISRPYWTSNGQYRPHDVDHKQELQLGGAETDVQNMWMLESSANRSSGSLIKSEIERRIKFLLSGSRDHLQSPPDFNTVRNSYTITVRNGISAGRSMRLNSDADPNQYWTLDNVKDGRHLSGLKFLTEAEVEAAGLRGSPDELILYSNSVGGRAIRIPWDEAARNSGRKDGLSAMNLWIGRRGGANLRIDSVIYNSSTAGGEGQGGNGAIICTAFPGSEGMIREKTNLAFTINPAPGVSYGGVISRPSVLQAALHALELRQLSPITLTSAELDDEVGLKASGTVAPTVPLIGNANINVEINADGVRISKIFSAGDFNFPPPFRIDNTSLEIFAGTDGLGIEGRVDFGIDQVGEGHIGAAASTSGGFELEGAFNFDSELFEPAEINVEYRENVWTIGGRIGIPEGKVRGVKNATITATYSENTFTASGEAELDIPGIQRGSMEVVYGDEGFSISGDFDLKDDIPGIRGGNVSATVAKQAGEEGYSVSVSGTAQPDIPGIDSSLTVSYENGALTIEGSAAYNRGMLAGTVNIGATNRPIGDEGEPAGEPDDTMRVYGGGSLTLTLTPWLQATAGVQFLENGEIEVTGRIGLPDTVDIFDRKSFDRNLFTAPAVEIPIFAIPLGPRSIGLVARITGGLDFSAGFGPGQLRNLYADVTYNPDHEDETTISGHGEFVIPADAGLTLRGDLGLGVSVGIASLTGGIEITGELGLEGEAAAEVDVNWSPQTGLALDATGRVTVNPKFTFEINAFARASLDLWITTISETWRYNLASFSWGPDIQFGIVFPVHYREGEPFDMSFDDIEVIYPDLDIIEMAKGLARDIKDRIFD
jgi:hypothetical protein